MASVFLSYSREDRAIAQRVVSALEADGCSVWWDGLLEGGERFSEATETALNGAEVVVVLWSKSSAKSHWVHDEATRGRDRGRLVPASIDGTSPPLGFGQFQALDLAKWKGKAGAPEIAALVRAIGIAAGQPETERPPSPLATSGPSRRALMIGGGASLLLAGGGIAAWNAGLFAPDGVQNSVAVLPFRNLSGDSKKDYFAEGLSAEIRSALARNPLLKVASAASSEAFGDRKATAPEISQRLGIEFVLDGNMRQAGNSLKIFSELIDGKTGLVTWSRTAEVALDKVLETQRDIVRTVGEALTLQVQGSGVSKSSQWREFGETNSTAAFDAFLQARGIFRHDNDPVAALKKLDLAVEIDPDYGAALAERSRMETHAGRIAETLGAQQDHLRRAIVAGRRAVSVAPKLAIGYSQLGFALTYGNPSVAEARGPYEKSKELGWNDSHVVISYAIYLSTIGQHEAALAACERAISIDPLNSSHSPSKGVILLEARKFDEWLAFLPKMNADMKSDLDINWAKCLVSLYQNNASAAEKYLRAAKGFDEPYAYNAIIEYKKGNKSSAEKYMDMILSGFDKGGYRDERHFAVAFVRAAQGEVELALDALERAYAVRDWKLVDFYVSPFLDVLRKEPRFKKVYGAMGFAV